MNEDHPIYKAIDAGGGQCCDIPGILRALDAAGYVIVPRISTDAMLASGSALFILSLIFMSIHDRHGLGLPLFVCGISLMLCATWLESVGAG